MNLLPLNGKRLISRIVLETSFAIIVTLEKKVKMDSSISEKTHSGVVLVVELVHEVELNSTVHDLCNEI